MRLEQDGEMTPGYDVVHTDAAARGMTVDTPCNSSGTGPVGPSEVSRG